MAAWSRPRGRPAPRRATPTRLRDELLAVVQAAMPLDMVLLGLHGAMVADGYDDCEGDILTRVRRIVGPEAKLGATLDPHSHLTPEMVATADVLVLFKEYPHSDVLARAEEMVELIAAAQAGRIRPVPALVDCHMVVPIHTTREPGRSLVARMQAMERDGALSVSVAQGFATGDVPGMGTKVLVYTDGDAAAASRLAQDLAVTVIGLREQLLARYVSVADALDRVVAASTGPIVLADRADNPGSGAAGDSTSILRAMLDRGIGDAAIGPIWDPGAGAVALEAGIGARLSLRIGGKTGPLSGDPVDLDCTVSAIVRDMATTGKAGTSVPLGDAVMVRAGTLDIVLITRRTQAFNTGLFTGLGCDPARKKLVVVKSAQHFYDSYAVIAREVIYVGAPGSASAEWASLPYRKIQQPKWPIS
jgi:microcystin degradation protein MlrC